MRTIIVDNNLHIGGYNQGMMVRMHLGLKGIMTSYIVAPDRLADPDLDVDGVILTGSAAYVRQDEPWMEKERRFISSWMERKIPILGICFGGQLIARHVWGRGAVTALPVPISGSIQFDRKGECPLFAGLPRSFAVVSAHYENFLAPEKDRAGGIAGNDSYAFWIRPNVFGLQFHPELMGRSGRLLVRMHRFFYDRNTYQDFSLKTNGSHGRRILQNFLRLEQRSK